MRQRRGGGGRVGCGRLRRLVGAGRRSQPTLPILARASGQRHRGPGPNPPDQPHSEKRPTELQAKGPVPIIPEFYIIL